MKKKYFLITSIFIVLYSNLYADSTVRISSPDKQLEFVLVASDSSINYSIKFKDISVIANSRLGFDFDSGPFGTQLEIGEPILQKISENYELIIGKAKRINNYCNQITIPLLEKNLKRRQINLIVRAYNDGIAFRFAFPKQVGWNSYTMYDEKTEINIMGNPKATLMYLPGFISSHEGLYDQVKYNTIESSKLIEMPITFDFSKKFFLSITEAAVLNYAGMYLVKENGSLWSKLSPKLNQDKIKVVINEFPHHTPWRVFSISARINDIIESNILTNLNEPCKLGDVSWLKPYKTTFPWWNGNVVPDTTFSPGNNFATNKYYIDFAARNKIDLHNIYGYAETLWYVDDNFNFGNTGKDADVTKPIPSLEMIRIVDYARKKGVGLHLWVHWAALYKKLEQAFSLYQKWGVKGLMVDFMNRDDQEMIKIQEEILIMAAKYQLFIQFHGSSKPSGLSRTYPNEFTREGTLNYEVYKWDSLVNSDHDISIPFTRMIAGPTDYHLGGFRSISKDSFKVQFVNPFVTSTRGHMLAMYIVLENPLISFCDNPKAYEGQDGFDFLKNIPGNWDDTKVLNAEMNEYITVARKNKDEWWVGAITNHKSRHLTLPLSFLDNNVKYVAEIYSDPFNSNKNMNNLNKSKIMVTSTDTLKLRLDQDGGAVVHFKYN